MNRPPVKVSPQLQQLVRHVAPPSKHATRSDGHPLPYKSSGDMLGVNVSEAPVPERRYAADVASVVVQNADIRVIFGQQGVTGELDTALVLRMSQLAARQWLESVDVMTSPNLDEIAKGMGLKPLSLGLGDGKPSQQALMAVNIVGVAVAGFETCLDFYHASAFAMMASQSTNMLEVQPIVRVFLNTALFVSLIHEIRVLAESFPPLM